MFHFLRPAWLLLLIPAALVTWSLLQRQDPLRGWKQVIAPELLVHLAINRNQSRSPLRPTPLLAACWFLGILALAGPTWKKEATPFTEDKAALLVILKVTPEMLAEDIQPSRLKRATQKIGDLLELRPGTSTGLIAYAGSAHLVMPLTTDPGIINYFAGDLTPDVMPVPGDNPQKAITLARQRLLDSGLPGSIVVFADSFDSGFAAELAADTRPGDADVFVLGMAAGAEAIPPPGSPPAPALDEATMQQVANAGGGSLVLITPDDSDVRQLNASIERNIATAPPQEGERWKDAGYFLLFGVMLLLLPMFRRGGAVSVST